MTNVQLMMAAHLRQEHGLSLRAIAERLGVSYQAVKVTYRDQIEGR